MTRLPEFPTSQKLSGLIAAIFAMSSVPVQTWAQQAGKTNSASAEKLAPTFIWAEQLHGRPDREIELLTDVEVLRGPSSVFADKAIYHIVEDEVEAEGNVRLLRDGNRYTGDKLRLRMDSGQGYLTHPTYRLVRNNAQGKAERMDFVSEDKASVVEGDYSTCEGPNPDWYLKSSRLDLDNGRDIGTAHGALLYFYGVPVLGAPAISFPLSDARKSGFLPPTLVTTNKGGSEFTVPYYFNIAPNRDLTLYPNIISRRGLQIGADARYLEPDFSGETKFETLFNDVQTHSTRYAISSIHTQTLMPNLVLSWNLNGASDNDYPNDFSHSITNATQRLLGRDVVLNYVQPDWNVQVHASNFQVLQDPNATITRPYSRLPQVLFHGLKQNVGSFDFGLDVDAARFASSTQVEGERYVMAPRVSYPIIGAAGFVTPKLSWNYASYDLSNQVADLPTRLTRSIPTFSLDSGLVFERHTQYGGEDLTQTLEPRLLYVRTPYRDQSQFPLFDTAKADLSFVQIFNENRFVGNDRVGDANQLTIGAVSRFLTVDGAERARLALAQRFYFANQRVSLDITDTSSRSDILAYAGGQINSQVGVDANLQYSESNRSLVRSNIALHWQPGPKKILNLAYLRDIPNNVNQIDVSGQWPLANRWYGVARINYSIANSVNPDGTINTASRDHQLVQGLLGAEYKADCWVFRLFAQRTPTATGQATTTFFYQLEFNGLARLGTNPLEALRRSVPGYQMVNQPDHL